MQKILLFLNMITFVFIFSFIGTTCINQNNDSISNNSANDSSIIKSSKILELPTIETSSSKSNEYTEKQIIAAICTELYGFDEKSALEHADYMMNNTEKLSEIILGNIISEEDAIQKARSILIELNGIEYIERIESDFVELNGETVRYQRNNSPYSVNFYEKYDVWLIQPNLPSGITEDGRSVMTPGMTPYVIIRALDGKVLAVFH